MNYFKFLAVLTLAIFLGACASNDLPDPEPSSSDVAGSESDANRGLSDDEQWGDGEEFSEFPDEDGVGELAMVIYFDFDQSEVRADDQSTLERHATRLANDSDASIRLEGHADERGSREYNIGLGERRSQAVRRLLLIQGASAGQISTVSFGEERPAAIGSDEEAYAQNRRVEIRFVN